MVRQRIGLAPIVNDCRARYGQIVWHDVEYHIHATEHDGNPIVTMHCHANGDAFIDASDGDDNTSHIVARDARIVTIQI